jgi:hypothetical protein
MQHSPISIPLISTSFRGPSCTFLRHAIEFETVRFPFGSDGELSPISVDTFRQCIADILLHRNYEGTDPQELARYVGFPPMDQTDAGKLAREVDLLSARDNGLVSDQKEHNDDAHAV